MTKEEVKEIVDGCMEGIGAGINVKFSELPDNHKTTLVNCINEKVRAAGFDIGIAEAKLTDFATVDELINWVYENQTEK